MFNNRNAVFVQALRKNVDDYFASHNIAPVGNFKLYSKTAILLTAAVLNYVILVFFTPPVGIALFLCALMGLNISAIGFNVMHDGAHGSYSSNSRLNNLMAHSLDLIGGSSFLWKIKHNVIHHTYTNIDGVDDDIDIKPVMRFSATQPKMWFHRFQHVYWPLMYSLLTFFWVFFTDFYKYFTKKIGEVPIRDMKVSEHLAFWGMKALYFTLFLILPSIYVGFLPMLTGYVVMSMVTGFVLAIVFQLAHVVEETEFPVPTGDPARIENEWAIHQVITTANFATQNKVLSWLVGGLNFQIEHHLFPKISHVHYPQISKIVKQTCEQFGIQYNEHPTMLSSIRSHVRHLRQMSLAA